MDNEYEMSSQMVGIRFVAASVRVRKLLWDRLFGLPE